MNLQPVSVAASGPATFTCCHCGVKADQSHGTVYADLEGEPFKDYYCAKCAKEAA